MMFRSLIFCVFILLGGNINAQEEVIPGEMTKEELMRILDCIGNSKNSTLCDQLIQCYLKLPEKALDAFEKCNEDINNNRPFKCDANEVLYESSSIPSMISDCITQTVQEYTEEEIPKLIEFDKCSRELYVMAGCDAS